MKIKLVNRRNISIINRAEGFDRLRSGHGYNGRTVQEESVAFDGVVTTSSARPKKLRPRPWWRGRYCGDRR